MNKYYISILCAVLLTVVAQILLKMGANIGRDEKSFKRLYFNKFTIVGICIFLIVTLLNLFALQRIELKELVYILPSVYLLIPIASIWILKEKINKTRILGMLVIILGMIIFNFGKIL